MSLGDYGSGYAQAGATRDAGRKAAEAAAYAANLQAQQQRQTRQDLMPWLESGQGAVSGLWDYLSQQYDMHETQVPMTEQEYLGTLGTMAKLQYSQRKQYSKKTFEQLVPESRRMKTRYEWGGEKFGPSVEDYEESPYYNFLAEEGVKMRQRGAAASGGLQSGAAEKELAKFGKDLASTDYQNWLNNWYQSLNPLQSMAGLGLTGGQTIANTGVQSAANQGSFMQQYGNALAAGQVGAARSSAGSTAGLGNALNNLPWVQISQGLSGGGWSSQGGVWNTPTQTMATNYGSGWNSMYPSEVNSMVWL